MGTDSDVHHSAVALRVDFGLGVREVYVVQIQLLVERRRLALHTLPQLEPELLPSIQTFLVVGGWLLDDRALVADDGPRLLRDGEVLARADRLDDLALVSRVQRAPKRAGDERGEDPERPFRRDLLRDLYVLSERYRRREK